jgi:HEAT repeat protein
MTSPSGTPPNLTANPWRVKLDQALAADHPPPAFLEAVRQDPRGAAVAFFEILDRPEGVGRERAISWLRNSLPDFVRGNPTGFLDPEIGPRFLAMAPIAAEGKWPEAIPRLIVALGVKDGRLTLAAVRALAEFAQPEAIEALARFLLTHTDEQHLSNALRWLVPRSEQLIPLLLKEFPRVPLDRQAWILKYLAETDSPLPLEVYSRILATRPRELGLFCIQGLGKMGGPKAAAVLIQHLDHPEWFLRKRLVEALGRTKCPESIPPLIRALTDDSVLVRAAAIESLSRVGSCRPAALIEALPSASHVSKVGLIRAMGQMRDPLFLESLVSTLGDRSTLFFSIDALGELGCKEAGPKLQPLLRDEEWFNRLNTLEALAKLAVDNVSTLAQSMVQDENDMVRHAAERILSQGT